MPWAPATSEVRLVLGASDFAPHLVHPHALRVLQRRRDAAGGASGGLAPLCYRIVGVVVCCKCDRLGVPGH